MQGGDRVGRSLDFDADISEIESNEERDVRNAHLEVRIGRAEGRKNHLEKRAPRPPREMRISSR
jgi:hypothetical protein